MKEAGGLNKDHAKTDKGVLFYVSANSQYQRASVVSNSPGPMVVGLSGEGRAELLESPFNVIWTTSEFTTNLLGFSYIGVPNSTIEAGKIECSGYDNRSCPKHSEKIYPEDVIVVANLGFDSNDPLGRNVSVFKSFSEFEPYFFGRGIRRGCPQIEDACTNEFIVDLGSVERNPPKTLGVMQDKKFSEPIEFSSINSHPKMTWISNYGLLEGQDSVFSNQIISGVLSYYRTNRHGVFTYGVTFQDAGMVEISLDFQEQWLHLPGDRVFELEVSWDGVAWVSLGKIDLVSLNQNKPVSLVLTKRNPKIFQFRMKPVAGSPDIPVIQGLRICKVAL